MKNVTVGIRTVMMCELAVKMLVSMTSPLMLSLWRALS